MKKHLLILVSILSLVTFTGCGTSDSSNTSNESSKKTSQSSASLTLSVDADITADSKGDVKIPGKTTPDAQVSIGMASVGDSIKADSKGNFTLKDHISESETEHKIEIKVKLGKQNKSQTITIHQNPEIIKSYQLKQSEQSKSLESSKVAASSSEQARQASESASIEQSKNVEASNAAAAAQAASQVATTTTQTQETDRTVYVASNGESEFYWYSKGAIRPRPKDAVIAMPESQAQASGKRLNSYGH